MLYNLLNLLDETEEKTMLPINLKEKEDTYELDVALPGYSKDEISVMPISNGVKITVDKAETEKDNHLVKEFYRTQHCERSVRFAKPVDLKKVQAKLENGVLSLRIPVSKELENKIEIL